MVKNGILKGDGVSVIIRVFEAFSGVGAQRMALRRLGIEHKVVGISEIDKFAIRSYEAIHGETVNFGDISKLNPEELPGFDLFTYSFPCQDLSVAGKQQGMLKGQTRSGLLYECEKVIEAKRPKYLLLENVKNLVGKKFKPQFDEWLSYLEGLGYTNYWQVLNAKDYGVPQNRERVFVISILGEHKTYVFPSPIPLTRTVKDILENEVDERYYINKQWHFTQPHEQKHDNNEIAQINGINYKATRSVGDINKLCRTLDTMGGGQREPKILIKGKEVGLPCICATRGRYVNDTNDTEVSASTRQNIEINTRGTSNAITTVQKDNYVIEKKYRVRKLTPLECWRLMGFSDEDFSKAKSVGVSNSQLYKQAGNSIVVPVLEGIFSELFK